MFHRLAVLCLATVSLGAIPAWAGRDYDDYVIGNPAERSVTPVAG